MTFTKSIFSDARLRESMSLNFKSMGYRMHIFSSSLPKIASHTWSILAITHFQNPTKKNVEKALVNRCCVLTTMRVRNPRKRHKGSLDWYPRIDTMFGKQLNWPTEYKCETLSPISPFAFYFVISFKWFIECKNR
jgi:hypothetical protein